MYTSHCHRTEFDLTVDKLRDDEETLRNLMQNFSTLFKVICIIESNESLKVLNLNGG